MPASKTSGTWLDFIKSVESKHYLTTKAKSLNPADDTEPAWVVFDGPGDEDHVLYIHPDNGDFDAAVGYNANTATQSSGGTFKDGTIYNPSYNSPPSSHSNSITWWFYSGADWYWTVGKHGSLFALGWHEVNQYWSYHEQYDAARVAMLFYSGGDRFGDSLWFGNAGGVAAKIDANTGGSERILEENDGQKLRAGLSQANTWRATDATVVYKQDDATHIAGTIDGWGFDVQKSAVVPAHETELSAGGRSYQYILPPNTDWNDQPIFFRTG